MDGNLELLKSLYDEEGRVLRHVIKIYKLFADFNEEEKKRGSGVIKNGHENAKADRKARAEECCCRLESLYHGDPWAYTKAVQIFEEHFLSVLGPFAKVFRVKPNKALIHALKNVHGDRSLI